MVDLSIVIPVYNVEKYLKRCLDSVFNQNFEGKFEVIAINDGSTDGSLKLLNDYAQKYSNLTIINHETNKSVAVARKNGLSQAKGRYTLQIDSDDWIEQGMFSRLMDYAKKDNYPDIIIFDSQTHDGKKIIQKRDNIKKKLIFNKETKSEIQQRFFMSPGWNKMVKGTLVKDLVLGTRYLNSTDDLIFCFEIFLKASSIVILPETYYNYFYNPSSITNSVSIDNFFSNRENVYKNLIAIKEKHNPSNKEMGNVLRNINTKIFSFILSKHFKNNISEEAFSIFCKEHRKIDAKGIAKIEKSYNSMLYTIYQLIKTEGIIRTIKKILSLLR